MNTQEILKRRLSLSIVRHGDAVIQSPGRRADHLYAHLPRTFKLHHGKR
jgi:hypothetical protein